MPVTEEGTSKQMHTYETNKQSCMDAFALVDICCKAVQQEMPWI